MNKPAQILVALLVALTLASARAHAARGVTPYLPLKLAPEIEQQIERVLIIGGKPILKRPIAAATVLEALPKACAVDPGLCQSVRAYLERFMRSRGLTHAYAEAAAASDEQSPVSNRRGLTTDAEWQASARAYLQPNDYVLLSLGGVAYPHEADPAGSMLSVGMEYAQLDVGFRDRWLSPLTGSAMLLSTQAQTMPSITLSNYTPMTRLGFSYEVFLARMSRSDRIAFQDGFTSGHPNLAGLQLAVEPASGWSLGVNRIVQFGGGERGGNSLGDIFRAFVNPSRYDNIGDNLSRDEEFGNQAASVTSRFLYPGKRPFAVYFEYGGEDTSRGRNYLLGNSSLSIGIDIPQLFPNVRFTYEASEWQNAWYVHSIYQDGLTQKGRPIGHWGATQRARGDGVGAQSHMIEVAWTTPFGSLLEARYQTLANEGYSFHSYQRHHDVSVRYSFDWNAINLGAEIRAGRDVFGEDYRRFAAFVAFPSVGIARARPGEFATQSASAGEFFVDAGLGMGRVKVDLVAETQPYWRSTSGAHLGAGVRRSVAGNAELGTRIELDDVNGHALLGVRLVDYAHRVTDRLALTAFLGAARYDLATPAYGFYYGLGVRIRDVLPRYDVGLDLRYADKVARDLLLPDDPVSESSDSFYDVALATLYITRRW